MSPSSSEHQRDGPALGPAPGAGRLLDRLVPHWLGRGARDLRPPSRRPRRAAVQVHRLPEVPWCPRGPRRRRVPGGLVRTGSSSPATRLTISTFTFVGEALLIVWLFKLAIRGSRSVERPRVDRGLAGRRIRGGRVMNALNRRHFARPSYVGGSRHESFAQQSTSTRSPVTRHPRLARRRRRPCRRPAPRPGVGRLGAAGHRVRDSSPSGSAGASWPSCRPGSVPSRRPGWRCPPLFLGSIGLGLIVFQPGPAVMDLLSWVWPPALAILADLDVHAGSTATSAAAVAGSSSR